MTTEKQLEKQMTKRNVNNSLVMIGGESSSGKSASLRNLRDPEGVAFLNCESGKELPFANSFNERIILKPKQVPDTVRAAEKSDRCHTIIIDTMTFLMDMYETQKVLTADDTRKAWLGYQQFWKSFMAKEVAASTKNILILAHTAQVHNESAMRVDHCVQVKGSLMTRGIESFFCNVITAKRLPVDALEDYQNDNLIITDEEKIVGYKYVFQTKLTKETVHERIRGPLGLWDTNETYIDNDAQFVLDRLHEYYNPV